MKDIVKQFIVNIMTNKDLSINKQIEEINIFLLKIRKLNKPYNYYELNKHIRDINSGFILEFIRNNGFTEYSPLEQLSQNITEVIEYNENMFVFTKYI
jgi:hypothetical protein